MSTECSIYNTIKTLDGIIDENVLQKYRMRF